MPKINFHSTPTVIIVMKVFYFMNTVGSVSNTSKYIAI